MTAKKEIDKLVVGLGFVRSNETSIMFNRVYLYGDYKFLVYESTSLFYTFELQFCRTQIFSFGLFWDEMDKLIEKLRVTFPSEFRNLIIDDILK